MEVGAVILAAGQGTRMRSARPKVLHPLLGEPMVRYSLRLAQDVGARPVALVVGHGADQVREATAGFEVVYVLQEEQLGTGHALLQARAALDGQVGTVLVWYADMPLLRAETVQAVVARHRQDGATLTLLTVEQEDSMGFGRVVRDAEGRVRAIVEERDCTPEQQAIRELNCGVYAFRAAWLWENLPRLERNPRKGEYYLTDLVAMATAQGEPVATLRAEDVEEVLGINTRVHLAQAEAILRRRVNERWMLEGVTLVDPARTYIQVTVTIGRDTIVWPDTYLLGRTSIGEGCVIGPGSWIVDSQIGNGCRVMASVLEEATMEDGSDIGPFSHLRRGAHIGPGAHVGNFAEVKNAHLGAGAKMGHFSYLGDAEVGPNANIGAGTITCNYDGERKHRTEIGEDAFLGSDTLLVAPVKVGQGAKTGAGAVVTRDVPPYTLAYGVPARVQRRLPRKGEEGEGEA